MLSYVDLCHEQLHHVIMPRNRRPAAACAALTTRRQKPEALRFCSDFLVVLQALQQNFGDDFRCVFELLLLFKHLL